MPGVAADEGVRELEEGEIEEGELVNAASLKMNKQLKKRNRAPSITTSMASSSVLDGLSEKATMQVQEDLERLTSGNTPKP